MMTTFIFAGGGTGGHLYPGLAIAESLRRQASDERGSGQAVRCRFLCSDRVLDAEILSRETAEFTASPAKPFAMRPRGLVRFISSWGPALRQARELIRESKGANLERETVHLVAMGGFVAAPAAQAARVEGIGLTLVNLDAVPGKANRWIARRADRVFTSAAVRSGTKAAQWIYVPPIVRDRAMARGTSADCKHRLGIDSARRVLLVTGGSQGARSLNDFVRALATGLARGVLTTSPGWHILHQTGKGEDASIREAYEQAGIACTVAPFVTNMADWWGAADLAVARAGAGNVGEAWANHVPTLFLPYPFHKDQHQRFNAIDLVNRGGCWIATDHVDVARNVADGGQRLLKLLSGDGLPEAAAAMDRLGPADGAERIATGLLTAAFGDGRAAPTDSRK